MVVVTCAVEALAGICVDIGHLVRAGTGARTVVDTRRFAPAEDDADLLILVVGAGDVAAALDRLAALRVGRAGRAALVAAIELDDGEIESLLAAGACDFLHLPVAPQELSIATCSATTLRSVVARRKASSMPLQRHTPRYPYACRESWPLMLFPTGRQRRSLQWAALAVTDETAEPLTQVIRKALADLDQTIWQRAASAAALMPLNRSKALLADALAAESDPDRQERLRRLLALIVAADSEPPNVDRVAN